jgi:nucleoside-diphosphate-sugar epimerase
MKHSKYSIVNWFIRQAMNDEKITIFGDGKQIRDYIYVEDLAEAMIQAAVTPDCHGETFNVGSGTATSFAEMVGTVVGVVGKGHVESIPWPENYINVETGDYITDISKLCGMTSWKPKTDLARGILATYAFYKKNKEYYFS